MYVLMPPPAPLFLQRNGLSMMMRASESWLPYPGHINPGPHCVTHSGYSRLSTVTGSHWVRFWSMDGPWWVARMQKWDDQ